MQSMRTVLTGMFVFALVSVLSISAAAQTDEVVEGGGVVTTVAPARPAATVAPPRPAATVAPARPAATVAPARPAVVAPTARPAVVAPVATARPAVMPAAMPRTGAGGTATRFVDEAPATRVSWMLLAAGALVAGAAGAGALRFRRAL